VVAGVHPCTWPCDTHREEFGGVVSPKTVRRLKIEEAKIKKRR
jgi:hypothetical protein